MKTIIIKKKNIDETYQRLIKSFEKFNVKYKTYDFDEKIENVDVDFITALGGDGTIIAASKYAINNNLPILGVNAGTIGFLSSVNKSDDFDVTIKNLVEKKYEIDNRVTLKIEILTAENKIKNAVCINELQFSTKEKMHTGKFDVYLDNENNLISTFSSDGLLVSTPTGASGYSFSVGSPIVSPSSRNIIITPIYPHTFNLRPIIIEDDKILLVKCRKNDIALLFDGKLLCNVNKGDLITIKKNNKKMMLIAFNKFNFFANIKNKLNVL